ncbi:ankyrin repeat and LEM domain-containing protein 1 [Drosophila kikkawai]|uniref:Ankyrin repeat and LEM domain-containing protein 1 n=1 Tax=Drosophila kikkawai TaxID=30033 RepID=A0A6P4IBD6_DROKI|nr:ankyrin repeat and LEM domain-containing protein 1 [Drosophila kikkawai]
MSKLFVFSLIQASPRRLGNLFDNLVRGRGISFSLGTLHKPSTNFSRELQKTLDSESNFRKIEKLFKYLRQHRKWYRENDLVDPHYFNYLLLDPRVTNGLRQRARSIHQMDVWLTFLKAIFYVGKGKASRPYVHLKKAQKFLNETHSITLAKDPKLALIVSIWRAERGILLLRAFRGISSKDAQTREAAIIDALGMNHLTNRRLGAYCSGPARSEFTRREQRYLGIALLYKLMLKFLASEEREIYPLQNKAAMAA